LAVPTKLGQDFYWQEFNDGNSLVYWEALHEGKPWLSVVINYKNWEIVSTNLPESAAFVLKVSKNVQKLSETRFQSDVTYKIRTNLQFPGNFGLVAVLL
jgi:Holliday junction resolvase